MLRTRKALAVCTLVLAALAISGIIAQGGKSPLSVKRSIIADAVGAVAPVNNSQSHPADRLQPQQDTDMAEHLAPDFIETAPPEGTAVGTTGGQNLTLLPDQPVEQGRCQPNLTPAGYIQERLGPIRWSDWTCSLRGMALDNTGASAACVIPEVPASSSVEFPGKGVPLRVNCKAPIFSHWDAETGLLTLLPNSHCDFNSSRGNPRYQAPSPPTGCAKAPAGMLMCPLNAAASLPFNGSVVITHTETVAVQCGPYVNRHTRIQPKLDRAAVCAASAAERASSSLSSPLPVPAPGLLPPHIVLLELDATSRHMFLRRMRQTRYLLEHPPDGVSVFEFARMHVLGYNTIRNMPSMLLGCHPYNGPLLSGNRMPCRDGVDIAAMLRERGWIVGSSTHIDIRRRIVTRDKLEVDHRFEFQAEFGNDQVYIPNGECPKCRHHYALAIPPSGQCYGGRIADSVTLDHAGQVLSAYRRVEPRAPVYSYIHLIGGHTETQATLALADDALRDFLTGLDQSRTFVFIFGDHGLHYGQYYNTAYGKLDHKNPAFFMLAPTRYLTSSMAAGLEANHQRLVTVLDLHATLRDVLETYTSPRARERYPLPPHNWTFTGRSLLQEIPRERTCADAGIDYLDCICSQWHTVVPAPVQLSNSSVSPEQQSLALRRLRVALVEHVNQAVAARMFANGTCLFFAPDDFRVISARFGERHVWMMPSARKTDATVSVEPHDGRVWDLALELRRAPPAKQPHVVFRGVFFLDHVAETAHGNATGGGGLVLLQAQRTSAFRSEKCPSPVFEFCVCAKSYPAGRPVI